jgi:hypothetical protein
MLRIRPLPEAGFARPPATSLAVVGWSEFFQSLNEIAPRSSPRKGAVQTSRFATSA